MTIMAELINSMKTYLARSIPDIRITDVIEMIIIAVLIYNLMLWIKNTRAWVLLKGILVLLGFVLLAYIFRMNTILWLADKTINVGIIAVVVIFQPELRRALEQLGRNKVLGFLVSENPKVLDDRFNTKTMNEIVKASFEMSKVKTGALIVIERKTPLSEYERTGIVVDGVVTSQLLLNIFEHNTPLHDGAIIVRGDRIVSATCYLPLSDNMNISKDLGTRHRAALGMSEVSDALIVVVSEETGAVSVAQGGQLYRAVDEEQLRKMLMDIQATKKETGKLRAFLKGRHKNEKKTDE